MWPAFASSMKVEYSSVFWLACRLPTCMNAIVRITPMTSQTMMVRIVLFTNGSFREKSLGQTRAWGWECLFQGFESARDEILFGALSPRRRGLPHHHFLERVPERSQVLIITCAH